MQNYYTQLIMAIKVSIILASLLLISALAQVHEIDLDLPPSERYTELAKLKKQSISSFISYLKLNVEKYAISFKISAQLLGTSPSTIKRKVGLEFYQQCQSIAKGASLPLSDVIVFNYMYELGAATDFCTAITVSGPNVRLLGRNLDYGYQEYLANNSVHLKYKKGGEVVFQTLGHAGLIGTHTALKRATKSSPYQYAATMNQRVEGGLHKTLAKIITDRCETSPYALMRALKECSGSVEDVIRYLNNMNTCTAVYWTIQSREGSSYVMEKNRGVGSHKIREAEIENNINFIVQTNHDYDRPDPDNRSTAARNKLINKINSNSISQDNIWQILTESPNFNTLTLMTGIIDVEQGNITYKVWN